MSSAINLDDLPEEDKFGLLLVDSELTGTVIETSEDDSLDENAHYFDGYEKHPWGILEASDAIKIVTTDGTFYIVYIEEALCTYKEYTEPT